MAEIIIIIYREPSPIIQRYGIRGRGYIPR